MNENKAGKLNASPEVKHRITKWIIQAAVAVPGYGLIIFLPVGRLNWVWGWVLLILLTALLAAHPLLLIPADPELLAERGKGSRDEGVKVWDKWITTLSVGLMIITWIVAGLNLRSQWSAPMPLIFHLAGLVFAALIVNSDGVLDAEASGASRVYYLGDPEMGHINTSGSSNVAPER